MLCDRRIPTKVNGKFYGTVIRHQLCYMVVNVGLLKSMHPRDECCGDVNAKMDVQSYKIIR